jgi:hypothetical protein
VFLDLDGKLDVLRLLQVRICCDSVAIYALLDRAVPCQLLTPRVQVAQARMPTGEATHTGMHCTASTQFSLQVMLTMKNACSSAYNPFTW